MIKTLWTIGHSNRPLEQFLELLTQHGIEAIADVRRFPGSRRQPQYAQEALAASLSEQDIIYRWIPTLGGRRRPLPNSPNSAWRNLSFRGYADYMATPEFESGLAELRELAAVKRTAVLCAESVWWRCHRALIADVLKAAGVEVLHILDARQTVSHSFTSPAHIVDGRLSYTSADDPNPT